MHFLRFGSSIPGDYWGCCAVCIIQNFKVDPDAKASIQIVGGDGGQPIQFSTMNNDGGKKTGPMYAGMTYRDIFRQRLRYGTFNTRDMPNHTFYAVLTAGQISSGHGKAWLKILKEEGFEFVRAVDNSVYTGASLAGSSNRSPHINYIFALYRNVGNGQVKDPLTPPKAWTDLPSVVPETWQLINPNDTTVFDGKKEVTVSSIESYMAVSNAAQLEVYNKLPKGEFYSEEELTKAGVPIIVAGKRSTNPQELKSQRDAREERKEQQTSAAAAKKTAPFKSTKAA